MSTIKVFFLLCAAVFLVACSPRLDVNELFLTYGSRVRYDELDTEDASDAGVDGSAGHDETAVDAGATVDAGDTEDAGVDAGPSKCSGACLPALAGWSGPLLVAIGAEPWALPSCPNGYESSDLGALDVVAPPAACSPCACSPSTDGSCAPVPWASPIGVSANTCAAVLSGSLGASWGAYPAEGSGGFVDGTCASFSYVGGPSIVRALWSNAHPAVWQGTSGTCAPSGGDPTIEPVTWGKHARACAPLVVPSGECNAGETCGSIVPSGFSPCIMREGSHECPQGLDRREVYRAVNDSRACSSCSCSAPNGETCAWTFDAFEQDNCEGTPIASLDAGPNAPMVCAPIEPASPARSVRAHAGSSSPGTCAPNGGASIGGVTPSDPVTLCCMP
jgi:hypothetical protein